MNDGTVTSLPIFVSIINVHVPNLIIEFLELLYPFFERNVRDSLLLLVGCRSVFELKSQLYQLNYAILVESGILSISILVSSVPSA